MTDEASSEVVRESRARVATTVLAVRVPCALVEDIDRAMVAQGMGNRAEWVRAQLALAARRILAGAA